MQAGLLLYITCLLLPAFAAASANDSAGQPKAASGQGVVEVRVEGLRSTAGIVFVSLYLDEEGYPDEWEQAYSTQKLRADGAVDGVLRAVFDTVPAGPFVVSVLHDENGDDKLSTNFLGIPREAYGFSNDARARLGPPAFEDAIVYLDPDSRRSIGIAIR